MRMMALGQAWQERGGCMTLASVTCPEGVAARVRDEGIRLLQLRADQPGCSADLQHTIELARDLRAGWVVLDGYAFDVGYQRALRQEGFKVLVVDDHGYSDVWAADCVLNQNLFAPERIYRNEVEACTCLLGVRFALLRREFRIAGGTLVRVGQTGSPACASAQEDGTPPGSKARRWRVLITMGGSDPENATGRVLQILASLPQPGMDIRVLVGAASPHYRDVERMAECSPHSVEVLRNVRDMPEQYSWADGVISAGGSSCWEWMLYHLPATVVCVAENQRAVIESLVSQQLALDLGWPRDLLGPDAVRKLRDWLTTLGDHKPSVGASAVDGFGALKVAGVLDGTGLWLRPAVQGDCRLYFEWANDPEVREAGVHTAPIPWESHERWFSDRVASSTSRLYLAHDLSDQPVGQVRFERRQDGDWEVGFSVAHARRSQGVGGRMLNVALRTFRYQDPSPVFARVRSDNRRSARVFEKLEFSEIPGAPSGFLHLLLRP